MTILSPEENNVGGTNAARGGLPTVLAAASQTVFDPSAGPAADLYTSKYTRSSNYSLSYPKDLESSKRGHAVYFDIYEISPLFFESAIKSAETFLAGGTDSSTPDTRADENGIGTTGATTQNVPAAPQFGSTLGNFITGAGKIIKGIVSPDQKNINPRTKDKSVATIALYMPETLNFNYDAEYNSVTTLAGAISSVLLSDKNPTGISSFMDNSALKLAMSAAGYVFNPQQQVLFEGISFRTYEMNFTFTPSSLEETNNINAIIKTLRFHAAPEIGGVGGFFFTPPSIFNVSFRHNGKVNPNINLLKRSVLKNVNVNYAPNGWAAFEGNGAPVQTTMALQFQEIVLVDKKEINKGF